MLRREAGDDFDAGLIDGPKGKARLERIGSDGLELSFEWSEMEPDLHAVDLIVGLSRPQTNRKILNEATSLGVRSIRFMVTERGEPSYAQSSLWASGEWRRHIVAGAAQAFSTRLPEVAFGMSLVDAVAKVSGGVRKRIALDNYEATARLVDVATGRDALALAVGSERGWTGAERDLLRREGFVLANLGERVLRTETSVVAGVSVVLARR